MVGTLGQTDCHSSIYLHFCHGLPNMISIVKVFYGPHHFAVYDMAFPFCHLERLAHPLVLARV